MDSEKKVISSTEYVCHKCEAIDQKTVWIDEFLQSLSYVEHICYSICTSYRGFLLAFWTFCISVYNWYEIDVGFRHLVSLVSAIPVTDETANIKQSSAGRLATEKTAVYRMCLGFAVQKN